VAAAAAQAVAGATRVFVQHRPDLRGQVQRDLGGWLVLALEFEIAADVLRTAAAPSWNEIGQLAAIVVLRTVLNYFLQRDFEQQRGVAPPAGGASQSAARVAP
jgi:uncharacterized membrane protein